VTPFSNGPLAWCFGSGFPKSLDVSKAIDKAAGAEREVVGRMANPATPSKGTFNCSFDESKAVITVPATDAARQWQGWGTSLKPAWEPIIMARKLLEGTVAENVLKWGTGAINVDGCRVGTAADMNPNDFDDSRRTAPKFSGTYNGGRVGQYRARVGIIPNGRWPANLVHDGSDGVVELFPVTTQIDKRQRKIQHQPPGRNGIYGVFDGANDTPAYGDSGSAARFFYCAKASKRDRDEGLEGLPEGDRVFMGSGGRTFKDGQWIETNSEPHKRHNHHPTIKPTALMRYLVRLVTPPGGVVLDPFMGSGSTGKACVLEGFSFVGIELAAEYYTIAQCRIAGVQQQLALSLGA